MDAIPRQLLLQVILIALNAFFAATEIAVISLNPAKLSRMADRGDRTAARLLSMVEEPSGFLSTIQVGITLSGFLASAFAADSFADPLVRWVTQDLGFTAVPVQALDAAAVVIITVVLSYFMLIFGELVPKRVAMQKSMAVAKFAAGVVSVLAMVMRPVIWFLSASTNGVLRLLRMKPEAEEAAVTEDDIRLMIDLGEEKGAIEPEEKEMLQNIFELGDKTARDVMTHYTAVKALPLDASREEVLELIASSGLSRFPAYDGDISRVAGILNARDYLLALRQDQLPALEALLRPAYFVPESIPIDRLFHDMQSQKLHIAVVVGEYGETCGIVTMEDLLEEIVGNIYDEFDPLEESGIQPLGDGAWRVAGDAYLEDLAEELDMAFPPGLDCDTLGGLVLCQLHTIPADGSVLDVEACGLRIHADRIGGRRILSAVVRRMPS